MSFTFSDLYDDKSIISAFTNWASGKWTLLLDVPLVDNVCETIMGLLSLFFNTVLLYLIKRHSNFASRVYTVMLTIDASLDLLLSVFVLFGQPVGCEHG